MICPKRNESLKDWKVIHRVNELIEIVGMDVRK
jgi:hypothetical protein